MQDRALFTLPSAQPNVVFIDKQSRTPKHVPMKKIFALAAAAVLFVGSAQSAIIFNPANPLNVVEQDGFTGAVTGVADPFVEARLRFEFTGLDPSPLPSSFEISGISLQGDGITTSLSFSSITITGNGIFLTSFVNLNNPIADLDFANTLVSFNLPGGSVINDGAEFTVTARYRSGVEFDQITSSTGPIFEAQNVGPEPIPEPGTWAAAALLAGGAAFMRWRKRRTA